MMLQKIAFQDYRKVTPIFQELLHQIVIGSLIEGNTCGDVYVNNVNNPTTALLWDKMDAIFVAGENGEGFAESLRHLLTCVILPDARSRFVPCLNIYYPNDAWAGVVGDALKELKPQKEMKYYYEFDRLNKDWTGLAPDAGHLVRVNEQLLEKTKLQNLEKVIGWITSFWPSVDRFVEKGIGYCILQNEIITGWCLSVFVSGSKYELGLETVEHFRGKGYAKAVATACIKYCLEHGLTPLWNCDAENPPSVAVAEAVGFKKMREYPVWHVEL
jgi:RimJ/RimL family protein N-acetyltransferase